MSSQISIHFIDDSTDLSTLNLNKGDILKQNNQIFIYDGQNKQNMEIFFSLHTKQQIVPSWASFPNFELNTFTTPLASTYQWIDMKTDIGEQIINNVKWITKQTVIDNKPANFPFLQTSFTHKDNTHIIVIDPITIVPKIRTKDDYLRFAGSLLMTCPVMNALVQKTKRLLKLTTHIIVTDLKTKRIAFGSVDDELKKDDENIFVFCASKYHNNRICETLM